MTQSGKAYYSLFTLICLWLALVIFRLNNISDKEISWDVLGYYMHLPATLIHNDPFLEDTTWLRTINEEKQLSGTLYQISSNDEGKSMYLFLMGSAVFYAPWFGIAHLQAHLSGLPADGFSEPYQFWLVIGALVYTLLGLWYFRKVLLHFLPDKISALVIFILVVGTNYSHHLSLKNLETVNILFLLLAFLVWNTIRWEQDKKLKYLLACGCAVSLMTLVKPSEIVAGLIPLLWGVHNKTTLVNRFKMFLEYRKQLILAVVIALLLLLPQMLYWYNMTGAFVYDSYKNPGVGLDFLQPHIIDVLFSFRKGWLIYTPVMLFALIGMYFFYRLNRKEFAALFIYFLVTFYIIASWTEWWYGAGFSNRPLVTTYVILGIGLGYFIQSIRQKSWVIKTGLTILIIACVALNQFQWWQLRNYILDPYRTTKASYLASFFATRNSAEIESKKLIARDFSGAMLFDKTNEYKGKEILSFADLAGDADVYTAAAELEFPFEFSWRFDELCSTDHCWIEVNIELMRKSHTDNEPALLAICADHGGTYAYRAFPIGPTAIDQWQRFTFHYLSPEVRSSRDPIKIHLWNIEKNDLLIRNFSVIKFEKLMN